MRISLHHGRLRGARSACGPVCVNNVSGEWTSVTRMDTDLTAAVQASAEAIVEDDSVSAAVDRHVEQLAAAFPDLDPHAVRVGLLYALSTACLAATETGITSAREDGVPWKQIAEPMGLSVSTVRTRFHGPTSDARRRYEEKRRASE